MASRLFLLSLVVAVCTGLDDIGNNLVVRGRLTCNGEPSSRVTVALTDEDRVEDGEQPQSLTVSERETGEFFLKADISSFEAHVDPTIEIVHKCNRRCIEKSRVRIPWEYAIERGPREINLHIIELSQAFPMSEETSFCDSSSGVVWKVPGRNN